MRGEVIMTAAAIAAMTGSAFGQLVFTVIEIDPFEDGVTGGVIGSGIDEQVAATVIGGVRNLKADVIANPLGTTEETFVDLRFDEGSFAFDTGPLATAVASLSYGDGDTGLGIPFSPGFETIDFAFASVDQDFVLTVVIEGPIISVPGDENSAPAVAEGSFTIEQGIDFTFSVNIFDQLESTPGFNLADANRLTFYFNDGDTPVESLDFRLDDISASGFIIPAPGSVALLGLGGLVVARRRR